MKTNLFKAVLLTVFSLLLVVMQTSICSAQRAGGTRGSMKKPVVQNSAETLAGTLEVGKTDSAIVYVGAETGDVAAYCFSNKSKVGAAILAACKKGAQCEVVGVVDPDAACKIKDERQLSASGRITSIKSVKSKVTSKRPIKGSRGAAAG